MTFIHIFSSVITIVICDKYKNEFGCLTFRQNPSRVQTVRITAVLLSTTSLISKVSSSAFKGISQRPGPVQRGTSRENPLLTSPFPSWTREPEGQ